MKLTPKGMRDIAPENMLVREEVIEILRQLFRGYGYRPLETPAMEYLKTLRAKAGPEVDKQIFVINGDEYGLRFDLTVPLARFASSTDNPKPFKRYAIDVVWRKEEPQRGRFREFYQADIDIVGSASMRCEAEVLSLSKDVCAAFGFNKPKIMINNRKILDGIAEKVGFPEQKGEVFRILDKLDKIGEKEVEKLLREVLGKKVDSLLEVIKAKGDNRKKLAIAAKYSPEGAKELEDIILLCDFDIEVDLFLVRGLGYYTGPVFEVKLSDDMGSVAGGGRYDNLLGVYGQPAPAIGISFGIERLITLIEEKKKSTKKTDSLVVVAAVKPEFYSNSLKTAVQFRKAGIPCETDLNERNLRKQFDYANALSIPFVAILGEREIKENKITLRDMASGKEEVLSLDDAIKKIRGR
ncbi:Histidine--tRNA ligase [Candidatus Bilamarchaeum dharawalense]|uniref:Histidine--tRNA ligase n=1 Tax=Candidatus Bilamarchaeum dharawalense TaxID=2885759 RepID=A0A5E4LVJ3_9ARCH|nr:Histidine--tRNA ligase [Candidatus Bilamarchaeum dharawalense]